MSHGRDELSVAIVGAGVSGCYAALALRREFPQAAITVIERLPVPYGLLRYGVAADHQGTKGVQQQFERLFAQGGAVFAGGLALGQNVSLTQLLEDFDAVVLATGLSRDRCLGVPGETLPGVFGSGRLTRALNSHPDEYAAPPCLASQVAVVGAGNVAVDIVRLLARGAQEWQGSDMDDHLLARIVPRPVSALHLVVRATPDAARWDAAMVRELAGLSRPVFHLAAGAPADGATLSPGLAALLVGRPRPVEGVDVHLHFGSSVAAIRGERCVQGLTLRRQDGSLTDIEVGSVVTAIGFERESAQVVESHPRVYCTGWLQTGPQGAIAQQRILARQLAEQIRADHTAGALAGQRPGALPVPLRMQALDFQGWRRVDASERAQAPAGRVRRKLGQVEAMRTLACAAQHG